MEHLKVKFLRKECKFIQLSTNLQPENNLKTG